MSICYRPRQKYRRPGRNGRNSDRRRRLQGRQREAARCLERTRFGHAEVYTIYSLARGPTEGNYFFGKDSVIVAHVNVRKRLRDPPEIFGTKTLAYPSFALPVVTSTETMSLHFNGEDIRLVHFPNGHTGGDTVIFFDKANVVHLGDDFFVGMFPFVDVWSGGSVQGLINSVGTLINQIPANAKIIPGHGGMATLDDLNAFHQILIETSKIVQDKMKKKRSLDENQKGGLFRKNTSREERDLLSPISRRRWSIGVIRRNRHLVNRLNVEDVESLREIWLFIICCDTFPLIFPG